MIKVERELEVYPTDFRLWVCLHESTHRLQFTAVPWMTEYFRGLVAAFAEATPTEPGELLSRAVAAIRGRNSAHAEDHQISPANGPSGGASGNGASGDGASESGASGNGASGNGPSANRPADGTRPRGRSWVEAVQTPEQRVVFDRLLALMTLLEGHADFVMDAVGPEVVPSVGAIRARFTRRRERARGPIDRLVRALLGMDAKLAQYVKGAAFTRAVVGRVGMDGFNAVWSTAEALPSRAEIEDPAAWVRRVHG